MLGRVFLVTQVGKIKLELDLRQILRSNDLFPNP